MRYLSLFSGIEAATQAWQPLGWECVGVSEIEPFPCAVLEHHYPHVPNLGDVTKITEDDIKKLGQIDLIVFGSPCQNLSVAGNRKGLQGSESSLFYAAMEIIKYAKQHCNTRFALWENVCGAFSSNKGADFTEVVKHMAGLDELDTPKNGWGKEGAAVGSNGLLEWSVLDAQWFGLAQRRKRVFAIVDFGEWASRPPILLERESLRGDSAPSREARESITSDVGSCFKARAFTPVSSCLYAAYGTKWNGNGAAYDGSLFALQPKKSWYSVDTQQPPARLAHEIAPCLAASMYKEPPSVICFAEPSRARALDVLTATEPSPTLSAKMGTGGNNMPMVARCEPVAYPINTMTCQGRPSDNGRMGLGLGDDGDPCPTITSAHSHAVAYGFAPRAMALSFTQETANTLNATDYKTAQCVIQPSRSIVRRLTPIECEKLQGFPVDFTKIPYRNKSADDCPNGVRYKALGNSMAVNVMAWIGQSINNAISNKEYDHE